MVKIKRIRTADAVVAAFRFGKEEGTVGSLILGMYDDDGAAAHRRPHLGLPRQAEARADRPARALPDRRARLGRAEPLEVRGGARLGGPASGAGGARSASTTSPATEYATARSSCAGATTRIRTSAISRSCVPDPAARSCPAAAGRRSGAQPEVYASGMRNPYRWSFDRQTGDMYVGDVGGTNEEITYLPARPGPRREPGLELLLRYGGAVRLHAVQLLPARRTSTRAARTW